MNSGPSTDTTTARRVARWMRLPVFWFAVFGYPGLLITADLNQTSTHGWVLWFAGWFAVIGLALGYAALTRD